VRKSPLAKGAIFSCTLYLKNSPPSDLFTITVCEKIVRGKSAEVVFRNYRSGESVVLPSPPPGIIRVESVKKLGVTIKQNLGFSDHVCSVVASICSENSDAIYALRTLRAHGMPDAAIHTIFQSTALARVQYASSAWYGFLHGCSQQRKD